MATTIVVDTTQILLSSVSTAIKDLIKFKIVEYVNTGDKTQDSLLNTLLLSILTFIFGVMSFNIIRHWISKCKAMIGIKPVLTRENLAAYSQIFINHVIEGKITYVSWDRSNEKNNAFAENIALCYFTLYANRADYPVMYDVANKYINKSWLVRSFTVLRDRIEANKYYPIYIDIHGIVALYTAERYSIISLVYTNVQSFYAFALQIERPAVIADTADNTQSNIAQIYNHEGIKTGDIFPDRNFDLYISRYKDDILNLLKTFQATNISGKAPFSGFGSFNLGVMLHGSPGTGKTLLMKAIANYLGRHIQIINMHKVKTKKDFSAIFSNGVMTKVFVLDEFDCVKGIIEDRSNKISTGGPHIPTEIAKLKERYLEVLKIIGGSLDTNNRKDSPLDKELESIKKSISDYEDALTLDAILTELDGVNEIRGRVIIAATNHIENIDPALMREGRFDIKIKLDKFNEKETHDILAYMYKDDSNALRQISNACFHSDKYTPAQIIGCVTRLRKIGDVLGELSKSNNKKRS